jgi:hypothetical protein
MNYKTQALNRNAVKGRGLWHKRMFSRQLQAGIPPIGKNRRYVQYDFKILYRICTPVSLVNLEGMKNA